MSQVVTNRVFRPEWCEFGKFRVDFLERLDSQNEAFEELASQVQSLHMQREIAWLAGPSQPL